MKKLQFTKALVIAAAAVAGSLSISAPAQASIFGTSEVKKWDVCNWVQIPETAMDRITNRTDFDEILGRMFDACPDSALALTDRPTASVDFGGGRDRSGTSDNGRADGDSPGNGGGEAPDSPGDNDVGNENDDGPVGLPG